ncbi:MAG TPA: hypothetical protein VFY89_05195 [Ktedonobacterales bacterium]
MANKPQRIEHEVIATWHERLSGPLTIAGLILLAVTLAGNLGVLFFGFAPGGFALAVLRVAPVVGGVVSAIGYAFTGYRWLRILRRLRAFNV